MCNYILTPVHNLQNQVKSYAFTLKKIKLRELMFEKHDIRV